MNAVVQETGWPLFDMLAADVQMLKEAEKRAVAERRKAEDALVEAMAAQLPDEGSKKIESGHYKVTIEKSVNRRVNTSAFEVLLNSGLVPDEIVRQAIRLKPEVDTKGFKYVRDNEPEYFETLANCIVSTQARPSVKVERIEGGE